MSGVPVPLEPPFGARDASGMAARLDGAAGQVEEALEHLAREPWRVPAGPPPALLAVGAMGGSAIAADLCAGVWDERLPRPVLVVRDARWPAWLGADALALVCSYSGNTAESLALYEAAGARGARRVALASGGALAERCARDSVHRMALPGGAPPRAALWGAWARVSALLAALGWIEDPAPAWRDVAARLRGLSARLGPAVAEAGNPAKRLARALNGRHVFVYTRTARLAAVATRWRQQLNENAKLPAHSATVPELNHNEIVGWERAGEFHARSAVVLLRDPGASPDERARLTLTAEFAREAGAEVHEVWAEGGGPLADAAELACWGDYLSLYLALLNGADPTPIASIDAFKRRLAGAAGPAERTA